MARSSLQLTMEWFHDIIEFSYLLLFRRKLRPEQPRKQRKKRKANMPKSLSPRRTELSLSYDPGINASSTFLGRLPLEVRWKIYKYALGGHLVHITLTPSRITHVCCARAQSTDFARTCAPEARHEFIPQSIPTVPCDIASALLRTCRQIYAEAFMILYSANTFDIDDLSAFVLLAGNIPPRGLAAIKSLQLAWYFVYPPLGTLQAKSPKMAPYDDATYLRFWSILVNQMPALKDLRVAIADVWTLRGLRVEEPWVQPLLKVKGLEVFELQDNLMESNIFDGRKGTDEFAARLRTVLCRARVGA